jgi:hypothetical protein
MEVFMSDPEFSDIEIFQHSGKEIPLFMTGHKNCLQADYLLGTGPRLIKKKSPGCGLMKVEKHCSTGTHRPHVPVELAVTLYCTLLLDLCSAVIR